MIVAYGPYSKLSTDNQKIRDNILDRAWKQSKEGRTLTFVTGDINSTVGCQQSKVEDCMGVHGKGTCNEKG